MSHFAKVLDGKVIKVIVADESFFNTFVDETPGQWIQTSYNTRGNVHYGQDGQPDGGFALRANYAGKGYTYDYQNDVFYAPRPKDKNNVICESFTIGGPTWLWVNPVSPPDDAGKDKGYLWDEATKVWVEFTPAPTVT